MKATLLCLVIAACSGGNAGLNGNDGIDASPGSGSPDAPIVPPGRIQTVFVIPFENKADTEIYGNTDDAPYINSLLPIANRATMFRDALPDLQSEPHYIWMEAGTNAFADHTFTTDDDASAANSTASTAHLVTQLQSAGIPWMSYQEGIVPGTCPITSTGDYAAKHNPMVFFQDVAGSPPSSSNAYCIDHHKPYSAFADDLARGITGYVFITPDLCHDMHGSFSCPTSLLASRRIKMGDQWLARELPRIIAYANTHKAVIFLTWDEGSSTNLIPFLALGPHIRPGTSSVPYTHSSLLKTTEEILGVPVLATVTDANDFADMFERGAF